MIYFFFVFLEAMEPFFEFRLILDLSKEIVITRTSILNTPIFSYPNIVLCVNSINIKDTILSLLSVKRFELFLEGANHLTSFRKKMAFYLPSYLCTYILRGEY